MEVPLNACLQGTYITDETGRRWPIWMEEPSDELKAYILAHASGRIWHLVEVEYEP